MRLPALPSDRRSPARRLGASYDHLVFNRSLLLWLHVVLALAAALMYLTTIDTSHLRWWRRGAAEVALLRSSASLVPYMVSAAVSRRFATARRFGIWLFALVLVAGTVAVGYFYVTRMVDEVPVVGTLTAVLVQTAIYLIAAIVFLARDIED
jgi:hypothetical protein